MNEHGPEDKIPPIFWLAEWTGYGVDAQGGVWSRRPRGNAIRAQQPHRIKATLLLRTGEAQVVIGNGDARRRMLVAELMLRAFEGKPGPGEVPAYRNGNPRDIRRDNLYWSRPTPSTLDEQTKADIRAAIAKGWSTQKLIAKFGAKDGVDREIIRAIRREIGAEE